MQSSFLGHTFGFSLDLLAITSKSVQEIHGWRPSKQYKYLLHPSEIDTRRQSRSFHESFVGITHFDDGPNAQAFGLDAAEARTDHDVACAPIVTTRHQLKHQGFIPVPANNATRTTSLDDAINGTLAILQEHDLGGMRRRRRHQTDNTIARDHGHARQDS